MNKDQNVQKLPKSGLKEYNLYCLRKGSIVLRGENDAIVEVPK